MGPCGFILVQLSIFCPDMGTPITLFKIHMGKWFLSLCSGLVTWLKCTVVGWILEYVKFTVSDLNGFVILTDPPLSVVSKKIWAGSSVPVIQILVIIFPSGVVICLDSYSRLLQQVRNFFASPALTILLAIFHLFCSLQLFCSHSYYYLPHFSCKEFYDLSDYLPHFHFFSFHEITL